MIIPLKTDLYNNQLYYRIKTHLWQLSENRQKLTEFNRISTGSTLTKWMPDRQFCIEKSIRNLCYVMEEKNSDWVTQEKFLGPIEHYRTFCSGYFPDIFRICSGYSPDRSKRMTDTGM